MDNFLGIFGCNLGVDVNQISTCFNSTVRERKNMPTRYDPYRPNRKLLKRQFFLFSYFFLFFAVYNLVPTPRRKLVDKRTNREKGNCLLGFSDETSVKKKTRVTLSGCVSEYVYLCVWAVIFEILWMSKSSRYKL